MHDDVYEHALDRLLAGEVDLVVTPIEASMKRSISNCFCSIASYSWSAQLTDWPGSRS
jgi:hypothetical protein